MRTALNFRDVAFLGRAGSAGGGDAGLLSGLLGYWKLNETSGDRADSSGNGSPLSEQGGSVGHTAGKIGQAALLDGASYLATANNLAALAMDNAYTVAAWVNITPPEHDTGTGPDLLKFSLLDISITYSLLRITPLYFGHLLGGTGTVQNGLIGKSFYIDDEPNLGFSTWFFMVFGLSATSTTITRKSSFNGSDYEVVNVDGVNFLSWESLISTDAPYRTLQLAGGVGHTLKTDEVGIWNRLLTQAEVTALYNAGAGKTYPF